MGFPSASRDQPAQWPRCLHPDPLDETRPDRALRELGDGLEPHARELSGLRANLVWPHALQRRTIRGAQAEWAEGDSIDDPVVAGCGKVRRRLELFHGLDQWMERLELVEVAQECVDSRRGRGQVDLENELLVAHRAKASAPFGVPCPERSDPRWFAPLP